MLIQNHDEDMIQYILKINKWANARESALPKIVTIHSFDKHLLCIFYLPGPVCWGCENKTHHQCPPVDVINNNNNNTNNIIM